MTKKGRVEVLGEAFLPEDLFTSTDGSSYGLGETTEVGYGMGVLEGFFEGDTSQVPDGMVVDSSMWEEDSSFDGGMFGNSEDPFFGGEEDDVGLDFSSSDLMREASVQNLDWLELAEQDPDRLPVNPVDLAIPELEEAWGNYKPTTLQANTLDLEEVRYRQSLTEGSKPKYKFSSKDLADVVRKAMRRSAMGHPLSSILKEAANTLGEEAHRIQAAMRQVQDEHGLAGNVYINASAYPGYTNGRWNEVLLKNAAAKYILVDAATLRGSAHIENGRCKITKKLAVAEVPWNKALVQYRPMLEGAGRKVASGDPREVLKRAFLSTPVKETKETHLPHHTAPVDRVSLSEARQAFAEAPREARLVVDRTASQEALERRQAWKKIDAWVKAGLVDLTAATSVVQSGVTAKQMLHRVAAMVVQAKGAQAFSGLENDARPPLATADEARQAMETLRANPIPVMKVTDLTHKQAVQTLARWVQAGLLDSNTAHAIAQSGTSPRGILHKASTSINVVVAGYSGVGNDARMDVSHVDGAQIASAVKAASDHKAKAQEHMDKVARDKVAKTTRAAKFLASVDQNVAKVKKAIDKGVRGKTLAAYILRTIPKNQVKYVSKTLSPILRSTGALSEKRVSRQYEGQTFRPNVSHTAQVAPGHREAADMLQWMRQAMDEGWAGKALDELLQQKYSSSVRQSAAADMQALRKKHEGASGFVYVDASVYASASGNKGCNQGALKHRANSIKMVLGMSRCASCALAQILPGGERVCQTYNKQIVSSSELPEELGQIRKANIRSANMNDQQATASLFAPSFDPDEFDLSNPTTEIDFEEEDHNPLKDIFFGGMEF